ncbi:uncharacterized protein PFL1_03788 [Pseudozyma flocculosa PF-1]|uniref:FAD-binding PCMH-type domain-containing protein n=2 Tax=Pseudozyma flocculosa TaxID=84751 RepID=A0A5C3EVW3_9BASI|nr:uncharacterized protein PFL1_03788 [Pseudozyma flocculosa PF-1]EPQ28485.1 hypothetical protein PFL1_03788 [Pseudozyma flocculosa PF-1]SPO36404.1 uncharacterized protein PSFLO_01875 [Pseudozyma flocculosa]
MRCPTLTLLLPALLLALTGAGPTGSLPVTTTTTTTDPTSASPWFPTPASMACAELSYLLAPATYRSAARSDTAFNLINTRSTPRCTVFPRSTDDVSRAMRVIFRHQARYAVQSGGHSGMQGWDTVSDGVLIHLSQMRGIDYDADRRTVTFGPGVRWGEVYNATAPHGVSVLGGRVGVVGTGLLLGGGLSFLSPQYGYASDQLVEVDVVLVDGRIVRASSRENVDLFRAIKGGGGRFGIVTRWQARAVETGTENDKHWYGGNIYYAEGQIEQVLSAVDRLVASPDDPRAALTASFGFTQQPKLTWSGALQVFYRGDRAAFEAHYADLLAIPAAIMDVQPRSYLDATRQTPVGYEGKLSYRWWGQMTRPSPAGEKVTRFHELWRAYRRYLVDNLHLLEMSFMSITPIKTTHVEQSYRNGGSVISPPRGVNFASVQHSDYLFANRTAFPASMDVERAALGAEWSRSADARGLPLFLNEADKSQDTFATYGAFDEMRRTYARWDPTRFSMRLQDGPKGL